MADETAESSALYPFQREVVREMLNFINTGQARAVYNACEQGLGKCLMTIRTAEELCAMHNIIVCPAVMRLTWKDEIERWQASSKLPVIPVLTYKDLDTVNLDLPSWVVISYSLLTEIPILNKLVEKEYDLLILDEAHAVKNHRARRTRACLIDLWPRCRTRVLLSGTPCTTSIVDLWTTAKKCAPSVFKDFESFAKRYTHIRIHPQWGARYLGLKHGDELKSLMRRHYFIRRTKEEVLPDLPPKTYQQISLPASLAVVQKTKDEASKLQAEAEEVAAYIKTGRVPVVPKSLAEHRRLQGERKIPSVVEFCSNLLEEEIPIVMFGWHTAFIEALTKSLGKFNPAVITGKVPPGERHTAVKRFQNGDTNLFIANLAAGGVGITLHRANICILGELDWAPSTVAQAVDRLHRIGQKNPVTIYYFVVKDSLDEALSNAVISRAKTISKVVDN